MKHNTVQPERIDLRRLSPDSLGGDITNPQSLNRYAYVLNNPTTLTDPSGLDPCDNDPNTCVTVTATPPPDIKFFVFGVSGGCTFEPYLCESNYYFRLLSLASGTGTLAPPPKPKPKPPVRQMGCSPGNASASSGQYFSGLESAATMLAEFLSGLGPDRLTFGPQSVESQMMSSSPGIAQAISYYNSGRPSGTYVFGLSGLGNAGLNPIQQFVGSYAYSVVPTNGGLNVTLSNYTSVHSGSYHLLPSHQRSTFGPLGTTHQTYEVFIPCHP